MHGEHVGATVCIGERDRDRHLAAQCGICRLELDHFDDPLVRHELQKTAVERVSVRGRFPYSGRRVIRERDSERATLAALERVHVARHAGRHHPRRDCARIEKRAIDARAGRVHAATDSGRAHAGTLTHAGVTNNAPIGWPNRIAQHGLY